MGMLRAAWQSCLRSIPRHSWVSGFSHSASADCRAFRFAEPLGAEAPQKSAEDSETTLSISKNVINSGSFQKPDSQQPAVDQLFL
jgi:hypothetical protein